MRISSNVLTLAALAVAGLTPWSVAWTARADRTLRRDERAADAVTARRQERAAVYVEALEVGESIAQLARHLSTPEAVPLPDLTDARLRLTSARVAAVGAQSVYDAFERLIAQAEALMTLYSGPRDPGKMAGIEDQPIAELLRVRAAVRADLDVE